MAPPSLAGRTWRAATLLSCPSLAQIPERGLLWSLDRRQSSLREDHYLLDAAGLLQQRRRLFEADPMGDHPTHGVGEDRHELFELTDRRLECRARRVDRTEDHLIVEHDVAHDAVQIDLEWR